VYVFTDEMKKAIMTRIQLHRVASDHSHGGMILQLRATEVLFVSRLDCYWPPARNNSQFRVTLALSLIRRNPRRIIIIHRNNRNTIFQKTNHTQSHYSFSHRQLIQAAGSLKLRKIVNKETVNSNQF
jgi:hypothetical protein